MASDKKTPVIHLSKETLEKAIDMASRCFMELPKPPPKPEPTQLEKFMKRFDPREILKEAFPEEPKPQTPRRTPMQCAHDRIDTVLGNAHETPGDVPALEAVRQRVIPEAKARADRYNARQK